jgi:hypothetical protein
MRRYLIILSALGTAIIVISLVKAWQRRRAIKAGLDPSDIKISTSYITGGLAGLIVFFIGVIALEGGAGAPGTSYSPAVIKDGVISSGGFEDNDN